MKVVLLKDIQGVGKAGELKEVQPGYVRNFLFPKKLAVLPADSLAKEVQLAKRQQQAQKSAHEKEINAKFEALNGKKLIFKAKADKEGKLYGSIGPKEIAGQLGVETKFINQHFKNTGRYTLSIPYNGKEAEVEIEIRSE